MGTVFIVVLVLDSIYQVIVILALCLESSASHVNDSGPRPGCDRSWPCYPPRKTTIGREPCRWTTRKSSNTGRPGRALIERDSHRPSCSRAMRSGSPEMRMVPWNGWSRSRIRKTVLEPRYLRRRPGTAAPSRLRAGRSWRVGRSARPPGSPATRFGIVGAPPWGEQEPAHLPGIADDLEACLGLEGVLGVGRRPESPRVCTYSSF